MNVEVENKTQEHLERIKMETYVHVCIRIYFWYMSESEGHKTVIEGKSTLTHFTDQNKRIYLNELIKLSG